MILTIYHESLQCASIPASGWFLVEAVYRFKTQKAAPQKLTYEILKISQDLESQGLKMGQNGVGLIGIALKPRALLDLKVFLNPCEAS